MTDPAALLRDLRRELAALEDDLRRRTDEAGALGDELRREHAEALGRGRTAATYSEWRDEQVTQAAVAWLLGCVFVRYCEDNGLVGPVWLAGPEDRRAEARDAHAAYFHQHPERNDRDWLLDAFSYLERLPASRAIFDREHNPLWRIQPSADAAGRLVAFWRRAGEDGRLVHEFAVPDWDTRFLGDLYQDLSETARKRYALLQTPEFVEEFILDRTLDHAIEERGVAGLKLIDPACGSGHFLLGAFKRLLEQWHRGRPGHGHPRAGAASPRLHPWRGPESVRRGDCAVPPHRRRPQRQQPQPPRARTGVSVPSGRRRLPPARQRSASN
jgi:hypothetical protein